VEGNIDVLKILLKYGADVVEDDGKAKALYLAAEAGHELTMQMLLDNGANISAQDWEGSTALDWAVPSGNENMVRLLLRNGADVKLRDEYGNIALHWATPYKALVYLLLEYGAEVDARNDKRQTALCWAAQDGSVENCSLRMKLILTHRMCTDSPRCTCCPERAPSDGASATWERGQSQICG
jgi:ankyrin repeat protein